MLLPKSVQPYHLYLFHIYVIVSANSRCVNMILPPTQSPMPEHLVLSIRGEEMPYHSLAWTFYGQNIIRVLDKLIRADITLIRTSKPAYKPGQKGNKWGCGC